MSLRDRALAHLCPGEGTGMFMPTPDLRTELGGAEGGRESRTVWADVFINPSNLTRDKYIEKLNKRIEEILLAF